MTAKILKFKAQDEDRIEHTKMDLDRRFIQVSGIKSAMLFQSARRHGKIEGVNFKLHDHE